MTLKFPPRSSRYNKTEDKLILTNIPGLDSLGQECTSLIESECSPEELLLEFIKENKLSSDKAHWFLPQLVAYFPSKFPAFKQGDFYNLAATLGSLDNVDKALLYISLIDKRSALVYSLAKCPEYAANIPLILSGYKKFAGINYTQWDETTLEQALPQSILDSMGFPLADLEKRLKKYCKEQNSELTFNTLNDCRRYIRSKLPSTAVHNPALSKTPYKDYPKMFAYLDLQLWCANPSVRNKYMILDPNDLDNMPEPLETSEVFLDEAPSFSKWKLGT
jgi:hypothetical protein